MDTVTQRREYELASVVAPWDAQEGHPYAQVRLRVCGADLFLDGGRRGAPARPAAPASLSPADREAWQIGAGFQYLHYKALGVTFNNYGYQAAFTRFFTNKLGAEATLLSGFGHTTTTPNFTAKSIFVGAGPHYAFITAGRFEPWLHAIPGWQHFRFTQGAILGDNNGFGILGGGG